MRLENKYRIIVLSMFIVLLMFGIYIGLKIGSGSNPEVATKEVIKNNEFEEEVEVSIYTQTNNLYDVEVIYEDEYLLCNHRIDTSTIIYNTNIDLVKESEKVKQLESNSEYEIISETKDQIVYHRVINQNCPNHFLIKLEDGIIVIYNVINETVSSIYDKIDRPINSISPEMIEELNIGIKVDSKEELNLILEDIES